MLVDDAEVSGLWGRNFRLRLVNMEPFDRDIIGQTIFVGGVKSYWLGGLYRHSWCIGLGRCASKFGRCGGTVCCFRFEPFRLGGFGYCKIYWFTNRFRLLHRLGFPDKLTLPDLIEGSQRSGNLAPAPADRGFIFILDNQFKTHLGPPIVRQISAYKLHNVGLFAISLSQTLCDLAVALAGAEGRGQLLPPAGIQQAAFHGQRFFQVGVDGAQGFGQILGDRCVSLVMGEQLFKPLLWLAPKDRVR